MRNATMDRCQLPQAFWRALSHVGLEAEVVMQRAFPAKLDLSVHRFFSTGQIFAIWAAIEAITEDPAIGIRLVTATDTAGYPPAFLAACYAKNLRDGITRLDKFNGVGPCEKFYFEDKEGEFFISKYWPYATTPESKVSIDLTFAYFTQLGRKGTGENLTPLRVDFARADQDSAIHRSFFACPIRYNAPRDLLVLKSLDVDKLFLDHNVEFLELLTATLSATVDEVSSAGTIAENVKMTLKNCFIHGRPDLAAVARALGVSERTLQRRITQEGKSFRALLMEARKELSRELLLDPLKEVDDLASLLGYRDQCSFYRAFKDWEGVTPGAWRKLNSSVATSDPSPRSIARVLTVDASQSRQHNV